MTAPAILWLRRDLRLSDHAALRAAMAAGPVIPAYILDDETPRHRRMGGASRWWLHHSLTALDADLRARGSRLILRRGDSAATIARLVAETGARAVHATRLEEPWWRNADRAVRTTLPDGVALHRHDGAYLLPPGTLTTGGGTPFRIFTPFWRALSLHMPPPAPVAAPDAVPAPDAWPDSDRMNDWNLCPTRPDWAQGFAADWSPGEAGGRARIDDLPTLIAGYDQRHNLPSEEGTSRLSPHLHFGEVSAATAWHAADAAGQGAGQGAEPFLRELAWRDYAANVIRQFPDYGSVSQSAVFAAFPWRDHTTGAGADDLVAWQTGTTGYPIVDAGMRQLWATGWMHNRVRMIAASFLIKHLLIDWRVGEAWFWDTLVDADYASNAVNWQWVAGSGVDANMFVRIMAPLLQSEKFDAGDYIWRWVPELAHLPDAVIHDPDRHGVRPADYPGPRIGHRAARERALAAWAGAKGDKG